MLKLTFLGTGTSQGVPMIGCECIVCRSDDKHDKRLRSSVMIESDTARIVIDAGPDFRYQMLRENVKSLDAILLTHEHKDHIAGLDDVRAFNYLDGKCIPIYCTARVAGVVMKDYDYAFSEYKYPGVPEMELRVIDTNEGFVAGGLTVIPVNGMHYRLPVVGYRIGDIGYITDSNYIENSEIEKLYGVKVFIVNALRYDKHLSHFTVEEAIAISRKVGAERTYFTHMSHQIGLHEKIRYTLPEGMAFAYDCLGVEV